MGLQEPKEIFGQIMMVAHCDYDKFKTKQLMCEFTETYKDSKGSRQDHRYFFTIDPYQTQQDRVVKIDLKIDFYTKLQISFAFLMPETKITIYLFPIKK